MPRVGGREISSADFEAAMQYARRRLEGELPDRLVYHSLCHTVDEVVPAVDRMAALEGISAADYMLVRTAAFFHDLGFVEVYQGHEAAGARIAAQTLPGYGFSPSQISVIQAMILATQLPQSPANLLEEILVDADLDILGKEDFLGRNQDLRAELSAVGNPISDERWYGGQLRFLQNHRYYTASARALRDEIKAGNIRQLAQLYQACLQNQPE